MTTIAQWRMNAPLEPLKLEETQIGPLREGDVLIRVAGCGLCHTDIGFYSGQVKPNHALPLTLGHEVSGVVEQTGSSARYWAGRSVVVPAILPCGECRACRRGRFALCPSQIFPGNDVDGGFASHLVAPARFLCEVTGATREQLVALSVVADAVSTPYEAIIRSGLKKDDLAVFVGAGGVGGFGVQIAAALGAWVVAVEPDETRRQLASRHGADLVLDPRAADTGQMRKAIREFAAGRKLSAEEWRIFETSGTTAGQAIAFGLMVRGSHLGVVGYTPEKLPLHLSRLMALDARAEGNWGCAPTRYRDLLKLIASGRVVLEPFVERRPLSSINQTLADMMEHRLHKRAILVPE